MSGVVLALVRRDLTVVRRSRPLMIPIIIVPMIFSIVLPLLLTSMPRIAGGAKNMNTNQLLDQLPPLFKAALAGLSPEAAMVVLMTTYLLAPLFLILPFMVANVIAADSFAGERERKTLESLLYTPLSDSQLFLAKTIVALVPAVIVTVASFVVYAIVVNATAWPLMHRIFFPNRMWFVLIGFVAPGVALDGLAAVVIVSMRVKGVQEAMQLSGLLVLPFIALVISQVKGAVFLGPGVVAILGVVVWAIGLALLRYGVKSFKREKLIAGG
jgi:ABC-type transport system involved in multi-copper enzyme maturation permease subunit